MGNKVHSEFRGKNCTERYLLCGGGTLFCLILGLEISVSCSICGTWEAILSELLSDTITDGSVETASEGASSSYLKNRKSFQKFNSYNSKILLHSVILAVYLAAAGKTALKN